MFAQSFFFLDLYYSFLMGCSMLSSKEKEEKEHMMPIFVRIADLMKSEVSCLFPTCLMYTYTVEVLLSAIISV